MSAPVQMKEVNFENEAELRYMAKTYVEVPLSWDSSYTYSASTVDKNFVWLKENKSKLVCLTCWDKDVLVGLHILFFDPENHSKECFIKTLWVFSTYRKPKYAIAELALINYFFKYKNNFFFAEG